MLEDIITMEKILLLLMLGVCIQARGPPVIQTQVDPRQIVRAGETVRLSCPVEGDPGPVLIEWSKDGENIHAGWERFKTSSDSSALRIKNIMEEDSGRYVCHAVNGFGSVDVVIRVWVHPDVNTTVTPPPDFWEEDNSGRGGEAPEFSRPDQMTRRTFVVPVGSPLRLKCRASGRPKPTIIWFKDGRVLPETEIQQSFTGATDEDTNWTLKLHGLQQEDSGSYTCKVFNRAGAINFTYIVDVIDRLSKPVIMDPHPYNISVVYGELASFECNVHSAMTPKIQWLKRVDSAVDIRNKNNTITVEGQQFVVLKSGSILTREDGSHLNRLNIYEVTDTDAGMYICLAANSMGYNIRSAFLTINPNPDLQNRHDSSSSGGIFSAPTLPVILAISAVIIAIIIIVVLCLICRRGNSSSNQSSASSPNSTKSSSVLRQPLNPPMMPGSNPGANPNLPPQQRHLLSQQDMNMYEQHQYAPIHHPIPSQQIQNYLQQQARNGNGINSGGMNGGGMNGSGLDQSMGVYHHPTNSSSAGTDLHSDISLQKSAPSPLPPQNMSTMSNPMHGHPNSMHHHPHYYQQQQHPQQQPQPNHHVHVAPPQHTHIHYNMT